MFIKFEFGSEAIPYIESCLFKGKTLSRYILQKQRIDRRKEIFAFLPPNTPFEERVRFLEGKVINESGMGLKIAEFIAEFLRKGSDFCAVFEQTDAIPSDHWLEKENKFKFFKQNTEVYLFLTSEDIDLDVIQNTIAHTGGFPSIGILTILPLNVQKIKNREELEDGILENLAANAQYIIVGAYDEEAKLFWCRE